MATMRTQHAGTVRMPFGEISGDRLQTLGSIKNRQNAFNFSANTSSKRKASEIVEIFCDAENGHDAENIDPSSFLNAKDNLASNKRSKTSLYTRSAQFETVIKSTISTSLSEKSTTSLFTTTTSTQRKIAKPHSRFQTTKPTTTIKSNPSTDKMLNGRINRPAGRSPQTVRPRSLLSGLARPTAPAFGVSRLRANTGAGLAKSASLNSAMNLSGAMPFDLSAALVGTVPTGLSSSTSDASTPMSGDGLLQENDVGDRGLESTMTRSASAPALIPTTPTRPKPEHRAAWDFEIHEDTADQHNDNIMSHSADQLALSVNEPSNRDSMASDKENVPPSDWNPPPPSHRSQLATLLDLLDGEASETQAALAADIQDDEEVETDHEMEEDGESLAPPAMLAATPRRLRQRRRSASKISSSPMRGTSLCFNTAGQPAANWDRSSSGGLARSPGLMNLKQYVSRSGSKKRRALGELPVEDFISDEVKKEEEVAKAKAVARGEGWMKRSTSLLSSITESIDDEGSFEAAENMDVAVGEETKASEESGAAVVVPTRNAETNEVSA